MSGFRLRAALVLGPVSGVDSLVIRGPPAETVGNISAAASVGGDMSPRLVAYVLNSNWERRRESAVHARKGEHLLPHYVRTSPAEVLTLRRQKVDCWRLSQMPKLSTSSKIVLQLWY